MDRGAWQATVHGAARVGHDCATHTLGFHWIHNLKLDQGVEMVSARAPWKLSPGWMDAGATH